MDAREFLGLEATHNPHRWVLPIEPRVCTGHSFLFGGCGLGAAIAALEGTTGRPVVWAAAQYLSYAHPPEKMDIDVVLSVNGKHTTFSVPYWEIVNDTPEALVSHVKLWRLIERAAPGSAQSAA